MGREWFYDQEHVDGDVSNGALHKLENEIEINLEQVICSDFEGNIYLATVEDSGERLGDMTLVGKLN